VEVVEAGPDKGEMPGAVVALREHPLRAVAPIMNVVTRMTFDFTPR
jgi:hypothetical protein